jgi:Zn-dependent M28 family amino/carboxypeptidase
MKRYDLILFSIIFSALVACSQPAMQSAPAKTNAHTSERASNTAGDFSAPVWGERFMQHIKVLASDDFEGRAPGTRGEKLTTDYLINQFKQMGLAPGNPDGSYVQKVPLIGYTSLPQATFSANNAATPLKFPQDFVAWSATQQAEISIDNNDILFVGYGTIAPEYGWDDYKGVDVKGKTIVMLINDPPLPDPADPTKLDAKMFKGDAMTYYGRWTYKFEMAAKLGAAAAIIVHETKPAAYPYSVVMNSWSRENFSINDGPNKNFPPIPAWIHLDRAKDLFRASGLDFDQAKKSALSKDFKPVLLKSKNQMKVKNTWRMVDSNNVLAKIEGSDPVLKNEYVIYTAHWDHFGMDEKLPGTKTQKIYHGALDNASGVAALLELARAFKQMPVAPKRTIIFLATTAEEQGLLGAQYYANHPLYPLQKTLANINMDGMNMWGRTSDVEILGFGNSTLEDVLNDAAKKQNRSVNPESRAELGGYFRSDHFEFAKVGVPALYMKSRTQYIGQPADYAKRKVDNYIANDYHKVTDVIHDDWNPSGAGEDMALLFDVGMRVAQAQAYPQWKPESEFRQRREQMLKQTKSAEQ